MTAPPVEPPSELAPRLPVIPPMAAGCVCHLHGIGVCSTGAAMTVPASEYDRPDRIFL